MKFTETPLCGAYVIDVERRKDSRGFFARMFCAKELREQGLDTTVVQCNLAFTNTKGTLRGLHWQEEPAAEIKLVRCTLGEIWDCIIDLRPESPSYGQHFGVALTAENQRALYIPKGFAHGYLTLTDNAPIYYQVSEFYTPTADLGVRHDDDAFAIEWPILVREISDRDREWPLYVFEKETTK